MADRPAVDFGFRRSGDEQLRRGVAWLPDAPRRRWLLMNEDALRPCISRERGVQVGRANRRDWWLVPAGAVVGRYDSAGTALPADADDDG